MKYLRVDLPVSVLDEETGVETKHTMGLRMYVNTDVDAEEALHAFAIRLSSALMLMDMSDDDTCSVVDAAPDGGKER